MSELLHVSSSPHVRSKVDTSSIMLTVIIALLPATLFGIYNFRPPRPSAYPGDDSSLCGDRSGL